MFLPPPPPLSPPQLLADLCTQWKLPHQWCKLQESDAQFTAALQTAQADLDWVVSELKAGKLSPEEAEECIKGISESVPTVKAAMAEVKRAETRGSYEVLEQESAGLRGSGWSPKKNESVRLLKFGGRLGKVGTHTVPVSAHNMCCPCAAPMPCDFTSA